MVELLFGGGPVRDRRPVRPFAHAALISIASPDNPADQPSL